MSRIQIQLPEKFIYETTLTVRASDLNYGAHVGHDRILTLMQDVRVEFYRTKGIENELHLDGTVGQVIADLGVVYKSEAFLGDELFFQLGVSDFHRVGFDMLYRVTQKASGKEVALAKLAIITFDYAVRKIAPLPPAFLSKLQV